MSHVSLPPGLQKKAHVKVHPKAQAKALPKASRTLQTQAKALPKASRTLQTQIGVEPADKGKSKGYAKGKR